MNSLIRILLIDDSLVFREALARGLSHEPRFEVLPTASSPVDALAKIKHYQPDIIVCDIEMPGMNGIDFLTQYSKKLAIPTIILSSRDDLKLTALRAGAAAFLSKPKVNQHNTVKQFIVSLMQTIVQVCQHKISGLPTKKQIKVIAIGASTGGTESITAMLQQLPAQMPPIVITQHIPEQFSTMFANRLNELIPLTVKEASRVEPLLANHVYVAPGNQHMSIKWFNGELTVNCRVGEKISGHRPSVDVLFNSVAEVVKDEAIGVLLTGMGRDGALGLLKMKQAGSYTIGQDEKTSIVYGMPKAAYDIGAVCKQLPLNQIAHEILIKI